MRILVLVCIASLLYLSTISGVYTKQPTIKVSYDELLPDARKQVDCLAENILFEAGNQPKDGQLAVALVTLNRVNSHNFPTTICSVVRQKVDNRCQFSWWCEGKLKAKALTKNYSHDEKRRLEKAKQIALNAYVNYDRIHDVTNGATFYHADYVKPGWKSVHKTVQIGQHIFYRKS